MALHSLAIAKASLAASLMRPEPNPLSRTDIAQFHRLLDALLSQCSTTNIQTFEICVTQSVALASAYDPVKHMQHLRKLNDLINIWSEGDYFSPSYIAVLRESVAKASSRNDASFRNAASAEGSENAEQTGSGEIRKDAPYIMPSSHGDVSTPFYDLPAGNLMPCITPHSLTPINPQAVRPVQLRAGPADEKLVDAVKAFLLDADFIYGAKRPEHEIGMSDIDDIGQLVIPNSSSGEPSVGEGYYGWSKTFCENMKLRNGGSHITDSPHPYYQAKLDSRRKWRYSYSDSSRSRSNSPAASRYSRYEGETGRMRRRRSDSDSRSRSRSGPQQLKQSCNPGAALGARSNSSRSRTRSYSPPDVAMSEGRQAGCEQRLVSAPPDDGLLQAAPPPPAFLRQGFFGPGQIPIPPPPPPNYHGPWPPPPPPPPPQASSAQPFQTSIQMSQAATYPTFLGPSSPPPPPPPPVDNSSPAPARAPNAQPSPQYMGQGHQGSTANLTGLAGQPWHHPNGTAASQGRGGWRK
ncbi:MAG: hypothetical protein Q9225_002377 [Loekoesia sp. 1 TL-2023]